MLHCDIGIPGARAQEHHDMVEFVLARNLHLQQKCRRVPCPLYSLPRLTRTIVTVSRLDLLLLFTPHTVQRGWDTAWLALAARGQGSRLEYQRTVGQMDVCFCGDQRQRMEATSRRFEC